MRKPDATGQQGGTCAMQVRWLPNSRPTAYRSSGSARGGRLEAGGRPNLQSGYTPKTGSPDYRWAQPSELRTALLRRNRWRANQAQPESTREYSCLSSRVRLVPCFDQHHAFLPVFFSLASRDRRASCFTTCRIKTPLTRNRAPWSARTSNTSSPSALSAVTLRKSIMSSRLSPSERVSSPKFFNSLVHGATSLPSRTTCRLRSFSIMEILSISSSPRLTAIAVPNAGGTYRMYFQ